MEKAEYLYLFIVISDHNAYEEVSPFAQTNYGFVDILNIQKEAEDPPLLFCKMWD